MDGGAPPIPILYIVHNNRAYHQEYMYLQAMAARHGRGIDKTDIGTTLKDPNIDYATVARGFGVHGEGPITDPNELAPALKRALARSRRRPGRGRRRHGSALRCQLALRPLREREQNLIGKRRN